MLRMIPLHNLGKNFSMQEGKQARMFRQQHLDKDRLRKWMPFMIGLRIARLAQHRFMEISQSLHAHRVLTMDVDADAIMVADAECKEVLLWEPSIQLMRYKQYRQAVA